MSDAVKLGNNASLILANKNRKIVRISMKKMRPSRKTVLELLLGPTGNLRAPAMVVGSTLVVGFSESMYDEVFARQDTRADV